MRCAWRSWTILLILRCALLSVWCESLLLLAVCKRESGAECHSRGRSQCAKLEKIRGTKQSIEISEEFRHLTLQVIGESILSMTPEESDSVFPHLYLPIMARII